MTSGFASYCAKEAQPNPAHERYMRTSMAIDLASKRRAANLFWDRLSLLLIAAFSLGLIMFTAWLSHPITTLPLSALIYVTTMGLGGFVGLFASLIRLAFLR